MDFKEQLRRHSRDNRFVVGGLTLLLVFLTAAFYLVEKSRDLPPSMIGSRVLLFILWYINIVLILTILFVLLRNIFKILVERRHRILGSKFKIKLVGTFIGLSLIPVLLLFALATELLQGSIGRWLDIPFRDFMEQGYAVVEALNAHIEETNARDARRALGEVEPLDLKDPGQRPRLGRTLRNLLTELELDVLAIYEGNEFIHAEINPLVGLTDLPDFRRDFRQEAAEKGSAARRPQLAEGQLLLAAVADTAHPDPEARLVVIAGRVLQPELAARSRNLVQAYLGMRQLEVLKEELEATHVLFFLMVTLLILLASSWVGLYLARRVTVPIQALAAGTRRIGEGDLGHRVDVAADDELGVLVDSFNSMTDELQRNKELLERGNRELVAANERLAEERALIAAVLHNVAAGVISIDPQGRIFTSNGAALKLLQQGEEIIGRPVAEVWQDPERAKLVALLEDGSLHRGHVSREVHLILAGEWKVFEVKVTTMADLSGGSGGTGGWVMVLEDLTELIKAQKLAAWNEAARRIAHEIKNPLTPIQLAAERLRKKHRQGDPGLGAALEEGIEIIVREVAAMKVMVDEFSRYARMPQPQPAEVDLPKLVEETLHLYRDLKPGVEVAAQVEPDASRAWLDPEQIKRVLINLMDNALEATDPPGQVTVSAHRDDSHLEIHVADTGRGIPAEAREKLFLPYFSTKGRGTGLGLAIVHRIVTDHHGSIRVEDNQPRGTVFTVELPLR